MTQTPTKVIDPNEPSDNAFQGVVKWWRALSLATKGLLAAVVYGVATALYPLQAVWSWQVENDSGCHFINWGALSGMIVIVVTAVFGLFTARNDDNNTIVNYAIIGVGLLVAVFLFMNGMGIIMNPCAA